MTTNLFRFVVYHHRPHEISWQGHDFSCQKSRDETARVVNDVLCLYYNETYLVTDIGELIELADEYSDEPEIERQFDLMIDYMKGY